jgi:hypothetical protein
MRLWRSTALALTAGALCGCTTLDDELSGRYGPAPVLADAVRNSVVDQGAAIRLVLGGGTLVRDPATGAAVPPSIVLPTYGAREQWYNVIWAGFNIIDDACMKYIDGLWKIERQKTRNSTILHAASAAGAALIGAARPTPDTAAALVILSQAFGLAGIVNNAIADSYLYSQSAANVYQLVRVTTEAYRDDLAKNFKPTTTANGAPDEVVYPMGSVPAAYFHMREYLSLCLPPAIQGQVDKLVTGAKSAPAGSAEVKKAQDQKAAGAGTPAAFILQRSAPRTTARPTVF